MTATAQSENAEYTDRRARKYSVNCVASSFQAITNDNGYHSDHHNVFSLPRRRLVGRAQSQRRLGGRPDRGGARNARMAGDADDDRDLG